MHLGGKKDNYNGDQLSLSCENDDVIVRKTFPKPRQEDRGILQRGTDTMEITIGKSATYALTKDTGDGPHIYVIKKMQTK